MAQFFTPRRRYDTELLDSPIEDSQLVLRTLADIGRSNRVFQGTRAAVAELKLHFSRLPKNATLLDVGTGLGDVPRAAAQAAGRRGVSLSTLGLDLDPALARGAMLAVTHSVCGSALALPMDDSSVDVVMCSQTLHHFRGEAEATMLREMNRVARVAVVVSDLRRSWFAASGFWAASFPLGFHPVTRHDGVLSVLRGYRSAELGEAVHHAVGVTPTVHRRLGFRVTTSWTPVAALT